MAATEVGGKAGVKFWVVNGETSGKQREALTQKLIFKLRPETTSGEKVAIADKVKRMQPL